METPPDAVILDPFAGKGTTLIEAKLAGYKSIGFELNPLLHLVCEASLDWRINISHAVQVLSEIEEQYKHEKSKRKRRSYRDLGLTPPPIHNVDRWWRPDVLADLLYLLGDIRRCCKDSLTRRFFTLALAGVLVPELTNVTLSRLQLHFINRDDVEIDVWQNFYSHAGRMVEDLEHVSRIRKQGEASVYCHDSTLLSHERRFPLVDRVVTSPPYPNRYSYVWNTRPHLYLLGFFKSATEAGLLDSNTVGGTWGIATSMLGKGTINPTHEAVDRAITPITKEIRTQDNLMANYVMKYFNSLLVPKRKSSWETGEKTASCSTTCH